MPIIEVNHVTKEYRLGQLQSLKHTIQRTAAKLRGQPLPERPLFKALDDVDFKVDAGEVLGIIGHNGAGKSTLLKMLAQISVPTRGSVKVHGKVAPLIEVGAGLIGDLTGRENVFLNGAILGIPKAEIRRKFDEIVAFAELEEFIDTPIKRYSSGMSVRLGFAIATSVESDILIVDEVLAVGDLAFQRKCFDRMENLIKGQGKTVLLVSHNIRQVERICSRVISLEHGRVTHDGLPKDVCNEFVNSMNAIIQQNKSASESREIQSSDEISSLRVEFQSASSEPGDMLVFGEPATIRIAFTANSHIQDIAIYIGIHTTDFVYLTNNNTAYQTRDFEPGRHTVELELQKITLIPGVYSVLVWLGTPAGKVTYHAENVATFRVESDDYAISRQHSQALFYMPGRWHFRADTIKNALS
ncbi:MAG: ABC transporter ATP-binding protein [Gammaproteobacteria bacterium]